MKAFSRVLSALLAALIMCVPLSGCAGSDTGALGLYTLAQVRDGGEVYSAGEAYAQPCTLELKRNKAVLTLDGNRIYGKWFVEDGVFDLVTDGGVSHGTLNDGVCTFDYLDDGLVHVFLREGAVLPDDVPGGDSGAEEGALARQWNGDWYGWWSLSNASGDWAALDGQIYDCFARISIDDTGVGTLRLWDEQLSAADPIGVADISVTPGADGSMGTARTLGGSFWLAELAPDEWTLDPAAYGFENMLVVDDGHYESDEGSFDYMLVLRPWGTDWSDVEAAAPALLPYFYNDWYLPQIESGASMPDAFDPAQVHSAAAETDNEE